jgi:HlyD family secretion protein
VKEIEMKRLLPILVIAILGLLGLLAFKLRSTPKPPGGTAYIEGIQIDLAPKTALRISKQFVQKGDPVKKGDLLIAFDCAETQTLVDEAEARFDAAKAQTQAVTLTAEAVRGQRKVALAARQVSVAQAASLAAQRDMTQRQAERMEALDKDVALAQRDQTRASALGLLHQVKAMEAQAVANQEQALAAGANWRASTTQTQAADASAKAAEAAFRRAKLLLLECTLVAPRDAWVAEIPHEVGELLLPNSVAIQLVDTREVRATFYLPNALLALAKPEANIEARADAYPGEAFRGRILTVGTKAEFTPRNIVTQDDRHHLVYPIEIALPNPNGKLRVGMPVEITLQGANRT